LEPARPALQFDFEFTYKQDDNVAANISYTFVAENLIVLIYCSRIYSLSRLDYSIFDRANKFVSFSAKSTSLNYEPTFS